MQKAELSKYSPERSEVVGKFAGYMQEGGFPCYSAIGNGVSRDGTVSVRCKYGQIDDLRLQILFEVPAKLKKSGADRCVPRSVSGNMRREFAERYEMILDYGKDKMSFSFDIKVE